MLRPLSNRKDADACARIMRGLPDHFTDGTADQMQHDLATHRGWALAEADGIGAFAVVARRGASAAEILWMATRADLRQRGRGTRLIEHVFSELEREGVQVVEVKTLDRSAEYAPYNSTRRFWEARGFVHIDTIDPLPGWEPGNPCAIYVAALSATRGAG